MSIYLSVYLCFLCRYTHIFDWSESLINIDTISYLIQLAKKGIYKCDNLAEPLVMKYSPKVHVLKVWSLMQCSDVENIYINMSGFKIFSQTIANHLHVIIK